MKHIESGFERKINWNKYQSKLSTERQNQYLDYLIVPSFQGVNSLFVLLLENENDRNIHTRYYLPKVEIKNYNVIVDKQNAFYQPVKSDLRTCDNIQTNATGQGDDYATGCLLNYPCFKKYYKSIENKSNSDRSKSNRRK